MAQDAWNLRATVAEEVVHEIRVVGGAAAVTKVTGLGLAVTYVATGRYKITWAENPGTYVMPLATLEAATPGDLAGHTVIFDTYDSSTLTQEFYLYNASFAVHDLAASEWINISIKFKRSGV